jgi:hypothetical protein
MGRTHHSRTSNWLSDKTKPLTEGSPRDSIYESHLILEYLEAKHPTPALLPKGDIDATLLAKQIEVVADGKPAMTPLPVTSSPEPLSFLYPMYPSS